MRVHKHGIRQMAWGKNQAALSEPVGIGLEFSACLIAIILRGVGATIWASHFIKIVRVFLKHEKRDLEIIWKSSLTVDGRAKIGVIRTSWHARALNHITFHFRPVGHV